MTARCELSDLPTEMCSHCKGLDSAEPAHELIVMRTITARFDGACEVCEEQTIREGDPLHLVDLLDGSNRQDLWAGTCCVKDGAR